MSEFADNTPFTVDITPDTAAYADGDVVGGLLRFTSGGFVRAGAIVRVTIADDDTEGAAYNLWLYDREVTTVADNAAFALPLASAQALIGKIPIASADYATIGTTKINHVALQTAMGSILPTWSSTIYGYLVTNGSTPTFAASKTIHIKLHMVGSS